jgi:hypothetical protein
MRSETNERIHYTITQLHFSPIFYAETSALTFNPDRKPNHITFGLSVLARVFGTLLALVTHFHFPIHTPLLSMQKEKVILWK